jgi:hypothetical protein
VKIEVKDYWQQQRRAAVNDADYMRTAALNLQRSIKQSEVWLGSDYNLWMLELPRIIKRFNGRLDRAKRDQKEWL